MQAVSVWQECVYGGYGEEGWHFWQCLIPNHPHHGRAVVSAPGSWGQKQLLLLPAARKGVCRLQSQPSTLCPSLPLAGCLGLETDLGENTLEWVSALKRMASVIPFANEKTNTSGWKWKNPCLLTNKVSTWHEKRINARYWTFRTLPSSHTAE